MPHKAVPCKKLVLAVAVASGVLTVPTLQAQEARGASSILLEEVVVTARKREEAALDVPLSVSALGSQQIEALKVRDLTNLAVGLPNVALDEVGTTKGTANFSIRGLGINSSIPSIDPTVGVFVDGVYLGVNNGIIFDTFDLESIQVLRGPQGILFGRNVTGGAILLNTKKPGDEFEFKAKAAVDGGGDGGINKYLMATVGGPITENLGAKFTAYYNDDDGYFENSFDGEEFGALEQVMFRPVVVWTPTDNLELTFRWEHSETEGDGPAAQSHTSGSGIPGTPTNFDRDSHDFSNDERGFQDTEADLASLQVDWAVGETGTITNIIGYRDYSGDSLSDIDAQPGFLFHAASNLRAEQFSNELRYNGTFNDNINLTTGVYYFNNEIEYHERRHLLGNALQQDGGGLYEVETLGVFAAIDYDVNEMVTLTAGVRYTDEEKDVRIASLIANQSGPAIPGGGRSCNVVEGSCAYDFNDTESWQSLSPKLGISVNPNDNTQVYVHWTRGYRSGGYNLRNTAQDTVNFGPGPFDEETVDSYEFGFKTQFEGGRISGAIFSNSVDDMQREVNLADSSSAVVQIIQNTADATIRGMELDGTFSLWEGSVLMASLGWTEAKYTSVAFDLNGDGTLDEADESLNLPRAPKITWSIGLTQDFDIGDWGVMTARANYAHRDRAAYTDNNLGYIGEQDILDAGLDFYSNDGHWVFSLYGKNLTDEVKHGGDTQLPATLGGVPLGGTFSPLAKGRVIGMEVTYSM